jgi:hypothetical protein
LKTGDGGDNERGGGGNDDDDKENGGSICHILKMSLVAFTKAPF